IFVPRRIKYELRASREWFREKERCVFCDIVRQEEKLGKRIVDVQGDYYALCPYAARVPYEIWVLHRQHNHLFEQPRPGSNRRQLAALLGRVLRRLDKFAPAYHLVVHTAPNTRNKKGELAGYWKTLLDDFHWHIEIFYADRATRAAEVYRQGLAPLVVASGVRLRPYAGIGELMEHDLIERGVPKEKILRVPHDAENTREEAEVLVKVATEKNWKRVIIVTSNYHTRRTRYIFRRVFPGKIAVSVAGARDGDFDPEHWYEKRKSIKQFMGEVGGMLVAMWELRSREDTHTTSQLVVAPRARPVRYMV